MPKMRSRARRLYCNLGWRRLFVENLKGALEPCNWHTSVAVNFQVPFDKVRAQILSEQIYDRLLQVVNFLPGS